MRQGRMLNDLIRELERQSNAKADYIAPARGMRMQEDGKTFELNHLYSNERITFDASNILHRQIGSAANIPARYYDLMQENKPELLAANINSWFGDMSNSYMVRSFQYHDETITFVSSPNDRSV